MNSKLCIPVTLEGMEQVRLLEWHGSEGDWFDQGDLIVELETHKAVIEVRAEERGQLQQRMVDEGNWCDLGAVIAIFGDGNGVFSERNALELNDICAEFRIG